MGQLAELFLEKPVLLLQAKGIQLTQSRDGYRKGRVRTERLSQGESHQKKKKKKKQTTGVCDKKEKSAL